MSEDLAKVIRMPHAARAGLEAALRAKKLDGTLTWSLQEEPRDECMLAPIGLPAVDAHLGGGLSRGQVSEIVGPLTSGRTTLALKALATATLRGELVALVDALDRLDVSSAVAAGIDLDRLLWIRGHVTSHPGSCRDANRRALDHAVKALTLVLQAGTCQLVVFDIAEVPRDAVRSLPFTTWLRLHRMIEGSRTACLLVSPAPLWRSPAGVTIHMAANAWTCDTASPSPSFTRLFTGLTTTLRISRARIHPHEPLCVSLSTTCA